MESSLEEIQGIDFHSFENISSALTSLKNSPDSNSKVDSLIDQVIQINNSLKEFFGFAVNSTRTHRDIVDAIKEHQEILALVTGKIQDLYSLVNGLSGNNNSLSNSNPSAINLQEVSSIVDLHSTHLDYHDQHLDAHDKELETLGKLIELYNR